MAAPSQPPSDDDLLTTDDAEAFGMFYDRHVHSVLGYFGRRTGDPEVAADLTAETFASALTARRRYRPGGAPAGAWLFAIAARRLADYHRRGRVEARAQKALAMQRVTLGADDAELVRMLGGEAATTMLADLPARPALGGRRARGRRGQLCRDRWPSRTSASRSSGSA